MKTRIKTGDEVVVISGANRGARGKVLKVSYKQSRILVEGVNKKFNYQKREADRDNPEGGIIEREAPIHISNVMRADYYDARREAVPQAGAKE